MRLGLSVAKDTGGFDYDRYFRSVAETWQISRSLDEEKYYFALNESALSDFMLGSCSHGIIMTIVTFMVYCGISLGFSSLIFRKKELSL